MSLELNSKSLLLEGFMGSGKSTLMNLFKSQFPSHHVRDLDELLQVKLGKTISEFVMMSGWAEFRQVEREVLLNQLRRPGVIALGGGTSEYCASSLNSLSDHWLRVWLKVPFSVCWERISKSSDERPLIREMKKSDLLDLYHYRQSFYNSCHIVLESDVLEQCSEKPSEFFSHLNDQIRRLA
jgi:shikimate kinase